jgi:hypothetical protein
MPTVVLEKTGTYIEGVTEVKNGAISSDVIRQYTAGIIKIEVLDEKRRLLADKATRSRSMPGPLSTGGHRAAGHGLAE